MNLQYKLNDRQVLDPIGVDQGLVLQLLVCEDQPQRLHMVR